MNNVIYVLVFLCSKVNNVVVIVCSKVNNVVGFSFSLSVPILLASVHVHHLGFFFLHHMGLFFFAEGVGADTCMCVCFVDACVHTHVCIHMCAYTCVHTHVCIHMYAYTHTHVCIHTYTCMHTHIHMYAYVPGSTHATLCAPRHI